MKDAEESVNRPGKPRERNRSLDFIRILLATLVLLGHAYELHAGTASKEPLLRLTRGAFGFGLIAVDFFFLLSGSLIVASWTYDPRWQDFLQKRCLRIVPGYVVAVTLSVAACGLLAPGVPHFFEEFLIPRNAHFFLTSVATLSSPWTPPVFPGYDYSLVNGSMWTLAYEARCYLLVLVFGVFGLFRQKEAWTVATVIGAILFHFRDWLGVHHRIT